MRASQDKHRDMARSILPSRYRSPVRAQATARRRNRRVVKQQLNAVRSMDDVEQWDERFDCGAYPDAEISQLVRWRRAGDKLNHFERWAVRVTAGRPRDDRLSYLRSILPDGLIGDHAMSHLERLPELAPSNPGPNQVSFRALNSAHSDALNARAAWIADLEAALVDLYEHGGQRDFNRDMRHAFDVARRRTPESHQRPVPAEAPVLRTPSDIVSLVGKAMFSHPTREVLVEHARRYRSSIPVNSADGHTVRFWTTGRY